VTHTLPASPERWILTRSRFINGFVHALNVAARRAESFDLRQTKPQQLCSIGNSAWLLQRTDIKAGAVPPAVGAFSGSGLH
jgi:hypothetical protein